MGNCQHQTSNQCKKYYCSNRTLSCLSHLLVIFQRLDSSVNALQLTNCCQPHADHRCRIYELHRNTHCGRHLTGPCNLAEYSIACYSNKDSKAQNNQFTEDFDVRTCLFRIQIDCSINTDVLFLFLRYSLQRSIPAIRTYIFAISSDHVREFWNT